MQDIAILIHKALHDQSLIMIFEGLMYLHYLDLTLLRMEKKLIKVYVTKKMEQFTR